MLIRVDDRQAALLNGALAAVATAGGTRGITDVDRRALDAFDRYILRRSAPSESPSPPHTTPSALAAAFDDTADRTHVVQFLIVMAVVDGTVNSARIATALRYANALGVDDGAVHRLAELARGNLAWVRADAQRQNMLSITGRQVDMAEDAWILPYASHEDRALADRFRSLGSLPPQTFGRTFFEFHRANGFDFPGEAKAVNVRFAAPHDSSHVLSG